MSRIESPSTRPITRPIYFYINSSFSHESIISYNLYIYTFEQKNSLDTEDKTKIDGDEKKNEASLISNFLE